MELAAKLCEDLGHDVEEVAPPVPDRYFSWFMTVFLAVVAQEFTIAKQIMGLGRGARRSRTRRGCAVNSAAPFRLRRCPWRWKNCTAPADPSGSFLTASTCC